MGRKYAASFGEVAVTAIQDLFELVAPSDAVVVVHKIAITQSTEQGDAEAEMLPVSISRSTGVSGSGGSALTARPLEAGDAAFGGTVEANNTTQATVTTEIEQHAFNVQAGFFWEPTPEERIVISPSARLVVELVAAPADSVTMSGTIIFEEIGG